MREPQMLTVIVLSAPPLKIKGVVTDVSRYDNPSPRVNNSAEVSYPTEIDGSRVAYPERTPSILSTTTSAGAENPATTKTKADQNKTTLFTPAIIRHGTAINIRRALLMS